MVSLRLGAATLLLCASVAGRAGAQQPLTLAEALSEAAAANARLPVAASEVSIARETLRQQRLRRSPRLGLGGDAYIGAPLEYASSEARLQLIASDTFYNGGRFRAGTRQATADVNAAAAGYRVSFKDVEREVRLRFSEWERDEREIAFLEAAIARLQDYLTLLRARQAGGEGVAADVLRTQVRVGTERSNLAAARSSLDEAGLELNYLLGRDPASPPSLAPLPPPLPPPGDSGAFWMQAPEVRRAAAQRAAAAAAIDLARAERRPIVAAEANVGATPAFGSDPAGLNNGRGAGGALTLIVQWPLWAGGIYRSQSAAARIGLEQAQQNQTLVERTARLEWERAGARLRNLYAQVQILSANLAIARDAYLATESLYRGGAATNLEVLDAFTAWTDANRAYSDALLQYRIAEANRIRWGTP